MQYSGMEYSTIYYSTGTGLLYSSSYGLVSVYSPQTSQIQAVEEGLSRTCVVVIPQGPLIIFSLGQDDSSSTEGVLHGIETTVPRDLSLYTGTR